MNTDFEKTKTILCYGDSNTFGHDPRSFIGDQYPPEIRWTGRLSRWGYRAENLGLNGRQIPAAEAELQAAEAQITSRLPADAVVVMLGTNDILWNPSFRAEDSAARMEAFLLRLLPKTGATPLLLLAPPPMQEGSWVEEARMITESERLGPLYAALAQRQGIAFADTARWGIELSFDGLHLTENGHCVFAEKLAALLENLTR